MFIIWLHSVQAWFQERDLIICYIDRIIIKNIQLQTIQRQLFIKSFLMVPARRLQWRHKCTCWKRSTANNGLLFVRKRAKIHLYSLHLLHGSFDSTEHVYSVHQILFVSTHFVMPCCSFVVSVEIHGICRSYREMFYLGELNQRISFREYWNTFEILSTSQGFQENLRILSVAFEWKLRTFLYTSCLVSACQIVLCFANTNPSWPQEQLY